MNTKLHPIIAAAVLCFASSAFAAADGSDYKFPPAQGDTATRADLKAEAVQAGRESRRVFTAPNGDVATAALTPAVATRDRAEVKAESIESVRVSHPGIVKTPD